MTLLTIPPEQLGGYITAIAASLWALKERIQSQKVVNKTDAEKALVSEALMFKERGDLMLKQANEYKELLEKEYQAHEATREYHHGQATVAQQKLSECNEKCQELQTKTDISRVEEILLKQTTAMLEMSAGIKELLKRP